MTMFETRVTACFPQCKGNLPIFSKTDLAWLVTQSITNIHAGEKTSEDALPIGAYIKVPPGGEGVEVVCLAHASRIVLIQMMEFQSQQSPMLCRDGEENSGFKLLSDLLKCSAKGRGDAQPLRGSPSADVEVLLSSLCGSEFGLLMYKHFETHVCVQDLELLADGLGCRSGKPFQSFQIASGILGKEVATNIRTINEANFVVHRGKTLLLNDFLPQFLAHIRVAIASYRASALLMGNGGELDPQTRSIMNGAMLDTRNVPARLIDSVSTFEAVETFQHLDKATFAQANLRSNTQDGRTELLCDIVKDERATVEVINEQFRARLMRNTGQELRIVLNVDGNSRVFPAKVVDAVGRKSKLRFVGDSAEEAMRNLRISGHDDEDDEVNDRKRSIAVYLQSITTTGREDRSLSEVSGMLWRRELMREKKKGGKGEDKNFSNLLAPLLFGDAFEPAKDVVDYDTIRLMEKPWQGRFALIAEKEKANKLNRSQAHAARAILSPLTEDPLEEGGDKEGDEEDDSRTERQVADRLILVHGPPGTGKTSLITACCQQFEQSCSKDEGKDVKSVTCHTIYACCQSNVAVKNIGESLSKGGVNFKIIVSPNFYVDWHEDLYDDIKPRLIKSDSLSKSTQGLEHQLNGCSVILCTLAFLSSARLHSLLKARPMRILMVDEASQIHLRHYPHVLDVISHSLARIIFLGDHRQLAPFNSEQSIESGMSVFELGHLRTKAMLLDTCYRLPAPMVKFISENVYDGKVKVGPSNLSPSDGLLACAAFVDVASGKESRHGKSRVNMKEVECTVALVQSYKDQGGDMSEIKVLTTYDAQREALEKALKMADLSRSADVVFSVDSFQGRESDHVILSLVRDGRETVHSFRRGAIELYAQAELGFLRNERRMNVAMTRARRSLTIVSNRQFIEEVASDTLPGMLQISLQFAPNDGGIDYWIDEKGVQFPSRFLK